MAQNCNSCNSDIWGLVSKKSCRKCYPIIRKIERVKSWKYNIPNSWKPIKGIDMNILSHTRSKSEFELIKNEIVSQLQSRIHLFKQYFSNEEVDGMELEIMLNRFSKLLSNANKDRGWQFHGYATIIDHELDPNSIKFIYKQLVLILINRRFKLDTNRIYKLLFH